MNRISRKVDYKQLEEAKAKSVDVVLGKIRNESKTYGFRFYKYMFSTLLAVAILVVVITLPRGDYDNPNIISAFESERLAEITYVASSFISSDVVTQSSSVLFLSNEETTEFENHDDLINFYFDTLKVFLDNDGLGDTVQVVNLSDSEYDQLISFSIDNEDYNFYITLKGNEILGSLVIRDYELSLSGEIEDVEGEFKIIINATQGNSFISLTYITEIKNDTEIEYSLIQNIDGIEKNKTIKLSIEEDEKKVEIKDGNSEYSLKKEFDDGNFQYNLRYSINDISGNATISEETDINGNQKYVYNVSEQGKEVTVEHGKPANKNDNGNNGAGNSGNQSNNYNEKITGFTI